jgi:adenylate kinase family enzyme
MDDRRVQRAGKSTLATEMADLLRFPVIHLDEHFWNPG